ncbi:hypothetical protein D3C81_1522360 [compost metagenome]
MVSRDRLLVPGALARVVALGHFRVRALGKHSVCLADVGELEVRGEGRLVDQAREVGVGALVRDVLRQVLEDQDPPTEPVLHAAGGQGPRLLDRGVEVLLDGVALQVVVIQSEQGERQDHDARSGQQDFMAELEIHVRGLLMRKSRDAFRVQHSM